MHSTAYAAGEGHCKSHQNVINVFPLGTEIECIVNTIVPRAHLPSVNSAALEHAGAVKPASAVQFRELYRTFEIQLRRGVGFHEQ